jgi:hypothetical protein
MAENEAVRPSFLPPDPRRPSLPAESTREVAGEDFLFHLFRGSELLQDDRIHEAKEELEQALSLRPRDPKSQDLLALVYFRLGLYPRAIRIYEELLREAPREPALHVNLALCYLKTGQTLAARTVLEELLRSHPNHRRAWAYLGLAHERLGELEKAEAAFERSGHAQMARRVAERRHLAPRAPADVPAEEMAAVRSTATLAYQELDAGEVAFALAEPVREKSSSGTWRAVELGQAVRAVSQPPPAPDAIARPSAAPAAEADGALSPEPRPLAEAAEGARIVAPAERLSMHPSGQAIVRVDGEVAFAARLESVRAWCGTLETNVLDRKTRTGAHEPFGGIASPLVRMGGRALVTLGPRPGHRILPLILGDTAAFLREEIVLGFELAATFENGRLPFPDGDAIAIAQLRGPGAVLVELIDPWLALEATADRPVIARRDVLLGWSGRLVPRVLPAAEAPGGHRGLVSLVGEGTVLLSAR